MRDAEHILHAEFVRVSIVRPEQFREEIDSRGIVSAILLFPFFEFCHGDLGHGGWARFPEWQIWSQRIVPEEDVGLGYLADNAIVPLDVVDVLDRTFNVDFGFQETELFGECHLSQYLLYGQYDGEMSASCQCAYIECEIMQQIPQVADFAGISGVLVQMLHEEHDHVLDRA